MNDVEYKTLVKKFYPEKNKNRLFRGMLVNRRWKMLYIYLAFKRYVRRMIRKEGN